jgi:rhodanese-related sulfurtransferase
MQVICKNKIKLFVFFHRYLNYVICKENKQHQGEWQKQLSILNQLKMDFEAVKKGLEEKSFVLIDVRNPDEVESAGNIPGSKQIPWPQLESALAMDDSEFAEKFGFEKPSADARIVTHCIGGGRAGKAQALLAKHGFENAVSYPGSFSDWVKNGGQVEKK